MGCRADYSTDGTNCTVQYVQYRIRFQCTVMLMVHAKQIVICD